MQINTTHKRPLLIFTLAAAVALSVPSSVRAQVDSWDTTSSGKWETAADWSLGVAPSISQLAVYITNADSILNLDKAVTIDATTAGSYPATMNTDYLIVSAPGPVGQSFLIITNATFTPLQLINLSIGVGGVVNMFDSLLVVKPGPGSLTDDGSMTVGGAGGLTVTNAGAVIVGNAANGELACPGGSSTLASNVVVGNLAGSTGVLTVSGGQVTVGPSQVSGDVDLIVANSTAATGTVSVSGGYVDN